MTAMSQTGILPALVSIIGPKVGFSRFGAGLGAPDKGLFAATQALSVANKGFFDASKPSFGPCKPLVGAKEGLFAISKALFGPPKASFALSKPFFSVLAALGVTEEGLGRTALTDKASKTGSDATNKGLSVPTKAAGHPG
jgi:hypothetical protein